MKKGCKKGAVNVLTAVLIIVIVVVAVGLVYNVVNPLISKQSEGVETGFQKLLLSELTIVEEINNLDGTWSVEVHRGVGEGDVEALRFGLETDSGICYVDVEGILLEQETKVFIVPTSSCTGTVTGVVSVQSTISNVIYLNACQDLDQEGYIYYLSKNLNDSEVTDKCFEFKKDNLILDCQGFSITSNSDYTGISAETANPTIKNCVVDMGSGIDGIGIFLLGDGGNAGAYLSNNVLNGQGTGLHIEQKEGAIIEDIIASYNSEYGIRFQKRAKNNRLTRITANNNHYGIYFSGKTLTKCRDNIVEDSVANNNRYAGIYNLLDNDNTLIRNTLCYNGLDLGGNDIHSRVAFLGFGNTCNSILEYGTCDYKCLGVSRSVSGDTVTLNINSVGLLGDYGTLMIAEELPVGSSIVDSDFLPRYEEGNIAVWLYGNSGIGDYSVLPPIAHYSFEGNPDDVSGNENHGEPHWAPSYALGISGQAVSLDEQDYIKIPSRSGIRFFDFNVNDFTLAAWFKTGSSSHSSIIAAPGGDYYRLDLLNSGQIQFKYSTGDVQTMTSPLSYNDNQWHYAVAVRDGSRTGKLYVDGYLVDQDSNSSGSYTAINIKDALYIGAYQSRENNFNGMIDEVKIWDSALSAPEIRSEYSNIPEDISFTYTVSGSVSVVKGKWAIKDTENEGVITNA